ncbi:MAG: diguanylate cyclase, partial [Saprospiraceae bacterium]|nr:diguanylate cyclase [Pyrinomonadaceae bacterium]
MAFTGRRLSSFEISNLIIRKAFTLFRMEKTERKERIINWYLSLLLPMGLAAVAWALYGFPVEKVNGALILLSIITIFFSSYLRIQLPRTKIHLTVSDALIFLSLLIFGGEVAVLLAVLETAFTSLNFRRQGVTIKFKTVVINIMIAAVSVFVTAIAVSWAFGTPDAILATYGTTGFIWALAVMAISQFLISSVLIAAVSAIKSDSTVWQVWNEYCLNALVMYVSGAAMAGISAQALAQINIFLFAAVCGFFALVYMTYRRNVDDVRNTADTARNAEQQRAEQAEKHILELQHYVAEMEKSSAALRESRELFRHAAYHDELTGLPNRNQIIDAIREEIEKKKLDSRHNFAVLFLDLNRFKTINDSLGHSTGDVLIKHVARRLRRLMMSKHMVGRFSGDEFAIVIRQFSDSKEVTELAQKVAKRLTQPFRLDERRVFTSVGIGIAFDNKGYSEPLEILRDADIAMYYAKENKKDFVIFDQKMHARAVTLLQLETDLRFAVERDELELFYQPVVGLCDTKLVGFEALVRWNHPTRGLISPNEFIPVSEDTGLIVPMTLQILKTACLQLVDWQKRFPSEDPMTVSVNLSGKHFSHPDLVQHIKTVLNETGITPGCLKLEITESAV